jgi:hypothetical protein
MSSSRKKPKAKATESDKKRTAHRSYVPAAALATAVAFDDYMMQVTFADGRVLHVPLAWFPVLKKAAPAQRAKYQIGGGGISLHWPDLDEDLSIAGLLAGADRRSA